MTANITQGSPKTPLERPGTSEVVRWLLASFFVVLALVLLAAFAAGLFGFRQWTQNRIAAKAVEKEVARLQLAGEPMTVEDLYRYHAVPKNAADTSPAWLAAQQSCNSTRLYQDGKSLPFVGDGNAANLRPEAADSKLAAAEEFLSKNDPALQAILSAAQQPGECRYPFKFEQGVSFSPQHSHGVRDITRLLALHVQVKALRGQNEVAIASLAAMFAASDTLSHQLTIVEQLVRLATLGSAMSQTEFLLSETQLNDEQLQFLVRQVAASDIQVGITHGLIGERALNHLEFQKQFGDWFSADCLKNLEVMTKAIQFSTEPMPDGRNHLNALSKQLEAEGRAAAAAYKQTYTLTALNFPSLNTTFDAYARTIAYQRALRTAIAAERHRLKTGQFPLLLTDLIPNYLPAIPTDPFDGQPLGIRQTDKEILIYSVGLDGKDDGATNPPGNSREPDIVVRLSSAKPQH